MSTLERVFSQNYIDSSRIYPAHTVAGQESAENLAELNGRTGHTLQTGWARHYIDSALPITDAQFNTWKKSIDTALRLNRDSGVEAIIPECLSAVESCRSLLTRA